MLRSPLVAPRELGIFLPELSPLQGAEAGAAWVFGSVQCIIDETVDGSPGDVEEGVAGSIVDEDGPIRPGDGPVAEGHIDKVPDAFFKICGQEITRGNSQHAPWFLQVGQEDIEDVSQAGSAVAHTMGNVKPTGGSFDGCRPLAVLQFIDGMVSAGMDDGFVVNRGGIHGIRQPPSNATAFAGIDETILRAGIKGIAAGNKFRVEDDVSLLRGG